MENIKVPVLFQPMQNFNLEDERFTKVKMWLMHLGENFNGSRFSKDAVRKAIPTLAYTPIMGLIKEEDFLGHEMDIVLKSDGDIEFKNLTQAYGVVPEFNNAQFEDRVGDDGVTRTYLTVEGLLWNKWEEAIDVISSKKGKTGQSMEIIVQNFAEPDENGVVDITDFQFDGACLLGDAVPPAMINSTVELAFSDKTDKIIKEKLAIFAKSFEKGGNDLAEDKKKDEEIIEDTTKKSEDKKVEEKPKETTKKVEKKEPAKKEEDKSKEVKKSEEDVEIKDEEPKKAEDEVVKEETVAEARKEQAEIEEKVETPSERIVVGENTYSIEEAITLIEDYQKLKESLHKDAVDELFEKYGSKLTEEDVEALKVDAYTKEIDEVETLIFAAIGKNQFSKMEETKEAVFSTVSVVTDKEEQDPYNGVLTKYLNK